MAMPSNKNNSNSNQTDE